MGGYRRFSEPHGRGRGCKFDNAHHAPGCHALISRPSAKSFAPGLGKLPMHLDTSSVSSGEPRLPFLRLGMDGRCGARSFLAAWRRRPFSWTIDSDSILQLEL